jgi:hypothetical protein
MRSRPKRTQVPYKTGCSNICDYITDSSDIAVDSASASLRRLAMHATVVLPSTREFHNAVGIPEIQNRVDFWKSVVDDDGDVSLAGEAERRGSGTSTRSDASHRSNRLDRERNSMQERLGSHLDSDEDDDHAPNVGYMTAPEPSVPPTHVPLPLAPPPLLSAQSGRTGGGGSSWESASVVKPAASNPSPHSELKIVFEKCRNAGSLEADISSFVKELRSCFGSSSTALRNELISSLPKGAI